MRYKQLWCPSIVTVLAIAAGLSGCQQLNDPTAASGGKPPATSRQLLSVEISPQDQQAFETALGQLPDKITEAEASGKLVSLDSQQVAGSKQGYSLQYYRLGGFRTRYASWLGGYAPLWANTWGNYAYYPMGAYAFPYYYAGGAYWRYRSAYDPFFYNYGGLYYPYYRYRLWF
ncbi:MAG: hypothetical protein VKP62_08140 [Candidatus Sericytochromatia bacterium]|nr:hypothetical protein [Candidatus Sericytochromatia bacterium]